MRRRYDHIDLRVRNLAEVRPFYETLLPALGFTRDVQIEHWLQSKQPVRTVGLSSLASPSCHSMSTYLWSDGPLFDFAVDLRTPSYSDNTDRLQQTFYWRKYVRGNQKNPAGRPSFA
jgi:hypothetical protein